MGNNKNLPSVSIVTVSFNQACYLEDNIRSVLSQQYTSLEHIIIDGGSTDGTIEILDRYSKYVDWISEQDNGQSHALNKGFRKAKGEIIGWINSDDRLHKGALQSVGEYFAENRDAIAVAGDLLVIDTKGNKKRIIKSRQFDKEYLINVAKGVTQPSTFFRRSVFGKIGYVDETLEYVMDRDLFIRIASLDKIQYLPKILADFREQPLSKTAGGSYHFAKELITVRRRYGGSIWSPGIRSDYYILTTNFLRKIKILRQIVQRIRAKITATKSG